MRILVTGSKGQLGSELHYLANSKADSHWHFTFVDLDLLDITQMSQVSEMFAKKKFDVCINCAAYTAVDKAESDVEKAIQVNVYAVENLAIKCNEYKVKFLHISTDYVYHSLHNLPYKESDDTDPKSVYGLSKLRGEQKAFAYCQQVIVVRTSWVYSSFGHNFIKTMLRLADEKSSLGVVFDQIGSPTYARDLAAALLQIVKFGEANPDFQWNDVYHYSNEGVCSWYDLAAYCFDYTNKTIQLSPLETSEYPTAAERPAYSVLNKNKIKKTFGIHIPHWTESLKACLDLLIHKDGRSHS